MGSRSCYGCWCVWGWDVSKRLYTKIYSYIKKINSNPNYNLISANLTGINVNCSAPKLIKTEVVAAELPKNENINGVDEEQIKKVLEQLQSGKGIDTSNLNELMSTLQKNNAQTDIDLGQLQGLLQSQSFMSQLATGGLLEKLSSEEFLNLPEDMQEGILGPTPQLGKLEARKGDWQRTDRGTFIVFNGSQWVEKGFHTTGNKQPFQGEIDEYLDRDKVRRKI